MPDAIIDVKAERVEDTAEPRAPSKAPTLGLDTTRPGAQWFERFYGYHYNPQGEAAFRALVPERYQRG